MKTEMLTYRAEITDSTGQGWVAVVRGSEILARFSDYAAARAEYQRIRKDPQS